MYLLILQHCSGESINAIHFELQIQNLGIHYHIRIDYGLVLNILPLGEGNSLQVGFIIISIVIGYIFNDSKNIV